MNGTERLRLMYIEVENDGFDFHSVALERLIEESWHPVVVIGRADFQGRHRHTRWVADLHSFTPTSMHAILQIAEGDRPPHSFSVSYIYSWRRWDLVANKELAVLRVCKSPFEPL